MAEQSPITGKGPWDVTEISSEYTPMNFPSRTLSAPTLMSFLLSLRLTTHKPLSVTVEFIAVHAGATSATTFGIFVFQQEAASGSQHQAASKW